jgi:itaconate CoA-transferase
LIQDLFRDLTAEQVIARLEAARIGNARVNEIRDLWEHAQLWARDRWAQVMSPVGSLPALKPPAQIDSFEYRFDPIPALGEHTEDILSALGYSTSQIERLRTERVI